MWLTVRLLHVLRGVLWSSHCVSWAARGRVRQRVEARLRPRPGDPDCPAPAGAVPLHALDAQFSRLAQYGAWRFDRLLDADVLEAALVSTLGRFPLAAGWIVPNHRGGGPAIVWGPGAAGDADAGRGAVWVRAEAAGAPPPRGAPLDSAALMGAGLVPPLRGYCLLAAQVTLFPDTGETILVASIDHTLADVAGFMRFIGEWSDAAAALLSGPRACDGGGGGGDFLGGERLGAACEEEAAAVAAALAKRPPTSHLDWDRAVLAPPMPVLPLQRRARRLSLAAAGAADESDDNSGDIDSSSTSSGSASSFWRGEPVWRWDPLSRLVTLASGARLAYALPECRHQTWLLSRPAIDALKRALTARGGKPPTANDVLSALLLTALARHEAKAVAARGGATLLVVANGRGRFGFGVPAGYFGNFSQPAPVWVPAELLLGDGGGGGGDSGASDASSSTAAASVSSDSSDCSSSDCGDAAALQQQQQQPAFLPGALPSRALVAFIHDAVRLELSDDPRSVARRRMQWMAAATAAGRGGDVRSSALTDLLADGGLCVDNVSCFPVFGAAFGGAAPAAAGLNFVPLPRVAWVSAASAGPNAAHGAVGGGDLALSMTLPARSWNALAPALAAAGLTRIADTSAVDALCKSPKSLRALISHAVRHPCTSPWV